MSSYKTHLSQRLQNLPTQQAGKGLVGFLAGLVLATMIIIAVLLMLNSNSKRDFKQEPTLSNGGSTVAQSSLTEASEPKVEMPSDAASVETMAAVSQPVMQEPVTDIDSATVTPPVTSNQSLTENKPKQSAAVKQPKPNADNTVRGTSVFRPHETPTPNRPRITPAPNRPSVAQSKPKPTPTPKPTAKPVEQAKAQKPVTKPKETAKAKEKDPQPTPQMILETGNIDKAREEARKQAATKSNKPAQKKTEKSVAKSSSSKGGNVVLQAGAFSSARAADAQRARLAMMGVQTKVSEAHIDGKSVYRVQTAPLGGDNADNARNTLKKNGVNVYERSVK